ncbi:hypothetical protein LINPERPRIM_LOCUS20636, partial [Linum perenne]
VPDAVISPQHPPFHSKTTNAANQMPSRWGSRGFHVSSFAEERGDQQTLETISLIRADEGLRLDPAAEGGPPSKHQAPKEILPRKSERSSQGKQKRNCFNDPSTENVTKVNDAIVDLDRLKQAEESLLRSKAWTLGIKEGDLSTIYFFNMVATRQLRNIIRQIACEDGNLPDEFTEISKVVVKFYQKLLGTNNKVRSDDLDILI